MYYFGFDKNKLSNMVTEAKNPTLFEEGYAAEQEFKNSSQRPRYKVKVFKSYNDLGAFLGKQSNKWKSIDPKRVSKKNFPKKSGNYRQTMEKEDGKTVLAYFKESVDVLDEALVKHQKNAKTTKKMVDELESMITKRNVHLKGAKRGDGHRGLVTKAFAKGVEREIKKHGLTDALKHDKKLSDLASKTYKTYLTSLENLRKYSEDNDIDLDSLLIESKKTFEVTRSVRWNGERKNVTINVPISKMVGPYAIHKYYTIKDGSEISLGKSYQVTHIPTLSLTHTINFSAKTLKNAVAYATELEDKIPELNKIKSASKVTKEISKKMQEIFMDFSNSGKLTR